MQKYDDYSLKKMPQFLKIKLLEFYFNLPLVANNWRRVKRMVGPSRTVLHNNP